MVKATEVLWITPSPARPVSAGIIRHLTGTNSCPKGNISLDLAPIAFSLHTAVHFVTNRREKSFPYSTQPGNVVLAFLQLLGSAERSLGVIRHVHG